MSDIDVSVCVPVYRAHPAPNLATLHASLPRALGALRGELVVALNGVGAQEVGAPHGAVLVDLGVNRGVAPGWNAAARAARGEILCFANDDAVLGEGALERLVGALRAHLDAGVVGPRGDDWDLRRGTHGDGVHGRGRPPGELVEVDAVSGFLFALRRTTFDLLGGFDEFYAPASWEEIDFCTAARARGLRCFVVGGVEVEHEWGISARQRPWRRVRFDGRSETIWSIHRRNRRHFLRKWAPVAADLSSL
jgi:GT2 family glycosyltransferase